jgi:hypothetical protein
MRMVTDWYRAFRFQVCPYSRFLEFHYKGIGIQKREQPAQQVATRIIREMIAAVMAGEATPEQAGDFAYNDFIQFGRERGFQGANNNFPIAKETAGRIRQIVRNFQFDPAFTVLKAGAEVAFDLYEHSRFASRPVAVVSKATGVFYLYFVKVTNQWKKDRQEKMHYDSQLLSEMEAVREAYPGDFGGAIVQVISTAKAEYEIPFLIPYDCRIVADYMAQVTVQEKRIDLGSCSSFELAQLSFRRPDSLFIQHRHACDFPYPCQFKEICWGDLRTESQPETDPRYMVREPELITEKELVASWKK